MRPTLLAAAAALALALPAQAEDLTLQSAFGRGLPILGPGADRFASLVSTLTEGAINFRHLGAGELSPPFEILENVGLGAIDAGWSYAGNFEGQIPAAGLFGSIPFGPDANKYLAWVRNGGGLELWREAYAPFNVVPMPCGVIISEAAGWYTRPIETVEDLRGRSIRIAGLGGRILARLGANPVSLPAGEISTAMQTGRLDGAELSFPSIDVLLGFDQVAGYYYFPGWHQPSGFIEFLMNADRWATLTDSQRSAIETACHDINTWTIAQAVAAQGPVLETFRERGVEIRRLPDEVLVALRAAAEGVLDDAAAADDLFRRTWESYRAFSAAYDSYQALSTFDRF
jgi:TRAP-type mannitol/chloroaromatic compound transport system substrate-binding protein